VVPLLKPRHLGASLALHVEAVGTESEAVEPCLEPPEVDLLLLGEGLAGRVDVRPPVRLDVEEVLHVEEGEAEDIVPRRPGDAVVGDVGTAPLWLDHLGLPLPLGGGHLVVDPDRPGVEPVAPVGALDRVDEVGVLCGYHEAPPGPLGYLDEHVQPLEVPGGEVRHGQLP